MPSKQAKDAMHLMIGLNAEDLKEVRAFADMRLRSTRSVQAATLTMQDKVLQAICDVCLSEGLERAYPARLKDHAAYKTFAIKCEDQVEPYMDFIAIKNRVREAAFLRMAIRLLITNLKAMNVPVSALMLMNHIHRLQPVVEGEFPGYAKSGLLHMVVRMERVDESQTETAPSSDASKRARGGRKVQRRA